jgi:hypothetical protein
MYMLWKEIEENAGWKKEVREEHSHSGRRKSLLGLSPGEIKKEKKNANEEVR